MLTRIIFISFFANSILGCSQHPSELGGHWAIDLDKMTSQATDIGATPSQIRQMKRTYLGAAMQVTQSTLVLSIDGQRGNESIGYQVVGKQGNCHLIRTHKAATEHRFCIQGRQLEVHDPSTKLVVIFNRV